MALRIKLVGSGSAQPKLLASVNDPNSEEPFGWKAATDWVAPSTPNEETGEGGVNFASVAAGYPVWDGSRIHTEQGSMSLSRFYELYNIPEADRTYFEAKLDAAYNAAMTMPDADAAFVNCQPRWHPRCITIKRATKTIGLKNGRAHLRVKPSFYGVAIVILPVPPTIEAEVVLLETKHDYFNILSTYAERPSMRGSNEAGELIENVEGTWHSPWPEDKHRAVVVGTMKADPAGTALDWTGYIIPTDEDGENGAKFAGTAATGYNPYPDEARLSELDSLQQNVDDIASLDPTHGLLIPAPTVGNPWRSGLYYLGGKLVMARAIEVYGQGVSADTQIPYSRLLQVGGYALERYYWPGESGVPPSSFPNARLTYPDADGGTRVGTLAASPTALDTYAYFFEGVGNSDISQMPWREMRCTVKSGNGRASSSASVACVAFYTGYYWGDIEVKINGADPKSGVQIETLGNIVSISVPLEAYWTKSGINTWSSGQTLNIVARWRGDDDFFAVANAAFNDVPLPSVPDPASVDFDEFRQWDFGLPSQN